jgi:hypothetical protein
MSTSFLHKALRRALLASLAVPVLADLSACGGKVVLDVPGAAGGAGNTTAEGVGGSTAFTGTSGTAGGSTTTGGCALLSTTPTGIVNGGCEETFDLAGPASDCSPDMFGNLTPGQCMTLCPPNQGGQAALSCSVTDVAGSPDGQLTCVFGPCGTGRRPEGLVAARGATSVGAGETAARFLGEVAHLEAASVVAFEQLAAELTAHGAPRRLVRRARRAAREEVRHARVMGRLAARAGARVPEVEVAAAPPRAIEAIAVENAVEGCVRETFGAVLAMRQAEEARSGDLRRAMKRIAREEAGHAELSWELARWLEGRLDAEARRRVREARDRAVNALARDAARPTEVGLAAEMGLPGAAQARAAIEALRSSLWAA